MQRKTERKIFAYGIAKQIHGFAKDNWEIDDIIGWITWIFKYCREREKTGIPEYPIDRWGNKLEIPSEESKGEGGERDEINKLE